MIVGKEDEGIVVMSFSSSAIKMAREWNRLMTTHVMDDGKRAKPYYLVWELEATYTENDQGDWFTPTVKYKRYIGPEQYKIATQERKALPDRRVDYEMIAAKSKDEDNDKDPGF